MQDAQGLLRGGSTYIHVLVHSVTCGTVQTLRPVKFMGRFGEWAGSAQLADADATEADVIDCRPPDWHWPWHHHCSGPEKQEPA